MALKLNHEIIDQIIFGMENQDQLYLFDLDTLEIVGEDALAEVREKESCIDLPEWNSSMGFNLMEKFVANLRNPVFREVLRESLAAGKGVFRRFKNALRERPDIERLWFQFKEKEMRRYVVEWFSTVQETRAFGGVEVEEEDETAELVLSDFLFAYPDSPVYEEYQRLDRLAYAENYPDLPSGVVDAYYAFTSRGGALEGKDIVRAETPEGDLAGFVCFTEEPEISISRVLQLYILPEYRGLGIGRALLERYLEEAYRRGVEWVFAEVGGEALGFADRLVRGGFARLSTGLVLDLHRWGMENLYS